jgi:hypothetical protein
LLHYAVTQKSKEIFDHVVSFCGNFCAVDTMGETPLHWVVIKGTYRILEALIKLVKDNQQSVDIKSRVRLFKYSMA